MKRIITVLLVINAGFLFGQAKSNKEIIKEINLELGARNWSIQGDNIFVNNGTGGAGRGFWGLARVSYEIKLENRSFGGGDFYNNTYVLYVKCKDDKPCIEDQDLTEIPPYPLMSFDIGADEKRANRILALLNQLK